MLKIHTSLASLIMAATTFAGSLMSSPVLAEQALAEAGKRHFIRCSACHSVTADGPSHLDGPHLEGIVGRLAGSLEDYEYTDEALTSQSFHWDEETLDEWLRKPQEMIADMCMPFFGLPRAEHREALIAYLKNPTP